MKALILGGGISGLSAAWFLQKKYPHCHITLLEKTYRLGGWMETVQTEDSFYEKGPRTFQISRSPHLLSLIRDLGLEGEMIQSDPSAAKRYLWHRGKLRTPLSFLPRLFFPLLKESFISKGTKSDESIYDFASRRFNPWITETLFDPLQMGIYAGDIRKLSLRSCFPKIWEFEQQRGSLFRGILSSKKNSQKGLFSLRGGMGRLIEELQKKLSIEIVLNCPVEKIDSKGVFAGATFWPADQIFCALPASVAGKLFGEDFEMNSLWVVHLIYKGNILSKKGFGYLVPSKEKEALLGMIWDSSIFPSFTGKTHLTALLRKETSDPVSAARDVLYRHLGVSQKPLFADPFFASQAIPQFEVGYGDKIVKFEKKIYHLFPSLTLLGNYFEGVSVEAAIARAFQKIISHPS